MSSLCSVACSLTKAVQLVCSIANLFKSLFKRILLLAVCAQYRVDYTLEEASSCPIGVEDADRRDRHGKGGVVANLSDNLAYM